MKAQNYSDLPVAILCGGMGTRLGKETEFRPKAMVEVNGRPWIHHQLDSLMVRGLSRFVLCIGHLGNHFFGRMGEYPVCYSLDGNIPLGTGGAVKNALHLLGDEFFVMYGDSYLPIDYELIFEQHRASGKLATMTTWNGVDFGMNIFTKEAFDGFDGPFDIHRVFDSLRAQDQLAIYKSPSRFFEIGSPEGLAEVRKLLA
jgi:NDP-sugar pyrophosphorylase family protein